MEEIGAFSGPVHRAAPVIVICAVDETRVVVLIERTLITGRAIF